jgi:2-C-methyl-D-erythritol 4-phosphate cytidylyltransferase
VPSHPRTAVVVVAGGSGTRVGGATNKVLLPLRGVPVLAWSLRTALALAYVEQVVVVAREQDLGAVSSLVEQHAPEGREVGLVVGGSTRHDSEWNGLRALHVPGTLDVVVVHDAARPLADTGLFDRVVEAAHEHGAAVPGRAQHGLVSRDGRTHEHGLVAVQTPQAFRAAPLLEAYRRAAEDGFTGTDTAGCVAAYTDLPVRLVPAPATNLKVTFPEDVLLAERLLPLSR